MATGSTLSSGFFLLPGLAFAQTGPSFVLAYLAASLPMIPGVFCVAELATAMPRSGGLYYVVDRGLGPMIGAVGGLGVWMVVVLKSSFALVGAGAYLRIFAPDLDITPIAIGLAVLFGIINLGGAKKSGAFQSVLVTVLLLLLSFFIGYGSTQTQAERFANLFVVNADAFLGTSALLCVSFIGMTKIASLAEEIRNPERNIPLAMFLALGTALIVYFGGAMVILGASDPTQLKGSLTPAALAAESIIGPVGKILITVAAVFAFSSVANAGIMSASRDPLAMSRDQLLPSFFSRLSKRNIPVNTILLTVGAILLVLFTLDPTKIAKLASAFHLLMFALVCLTVIIMRESRIPSYDPGFHVPLYPWLPLFGILLPFFYIYELGLMAILFAAGLMTIGIIWYFAFARRRVQRGGAIFHVFARLGELKYEGLDTELREIMREKGLRKEDPFDDIIARAVIIDLPGVDAFEDVVARAAGALAAKTGRSAGALEEQLLNGTRQGGTPVSRGAALPHIRLANLPEPQLVIARTAQGVKIDLVAEFWGPEVAEKPVYAFFFLASAQAHHGRHLRMLAQIAERVDHENFVEDWMDARNEQDLKEILLRDDRFLSLRLKSDSPAAQLIGKKISDIRWPTESLVALVHRDGEILIPRGDLVFMENDRLTVLGEPPSIEKCRQLYGPGSLRNKSVES